MLAPLQVIWIHDDLIRPPGPKMVVCVCPAAGLFMRINTKGLRPGSVPITRTEHPFLTHDSYVECGAVFELDDYVIEQSLNRPRGGILGEIARDMIPAMLAAIARSQTLRSDDKDAVAVVMRALTAAPRA